MEKIPQPKSELDIASLVSEAEASGHVDLRDIPLESVGQLADWYRSDFEQISDKYKVEFLEQLMAVGEFDDEESSRYVNHLSQEQRQEIGLFIHRAMDGSLFVSTFQNCWDSMDYDIRSQIEDDIRQNHLDDKLLMIAPFVNLTNINEDGSFDRSLFYSRSRWRGESQSKSILKAKWNNFDTGTELVENLLDYAELHPEEHKSYIVANLLGVDSFLLYPHLDRIKELGILSDSDLETIYQEKSLLFNSDQFLTAEEKQQRQKILDKLKEYLPEDEKDSLEYHFNIDQLSPQKLAVQVVDLNNRASARKAEFVLYDFDKRSQNMDKVDKIEYLRDLADRGVPIFCQIEELGLSEEEIKSLFSSIVEEGNWPIGQLENFQDMKIFIEYSREHNLQLEDILLRFVIEGIQQEGFESMVGCRIRMYGQEFFDSFSDKDREKIISTINQYAPSIWWNNLSYALDNNIISLDELVDRTSQDVYHLLMNYRKILYHISEVRKSSGQTSLTPDRLKGIVQGVVMANPDLMFSESYKDVIDELFSNEEKYQFISDKLDQGVDEDFVSGLMDSDFRDDFKDRIKKVLIENTDAFGTLVEYSFRLDKLKTILSMSELLSMIIEHAGYINIEEIVSDRDIMFKLGHSSSQAEKFLNKLISAQDFKSVAMFNDAIVSFSDQENKTRNKLKDRRFPPDDESKARLEKELAVVNSPEYKSAKEGLSSIRSRALESVDQACQDNEFLVFKEDIIKMHGLDVTKYIERDLDGYIIINPAIMMAIDHRSGKGEYRFLLKNILGTEKFDRLLRENIRLLAFRKNEYGNTIARDDYLDSELMDDIYDLNPIVKLENKEKIDTDYYQMIIKDVKDRPFAGLYINELEKIAQDKLQLDGPRLNIKYFSPDPQFKKLSEKICLLASHPALVEHEDWIMALPKDRREQLVDLLEFALLNKFLFLGEILRDENFDSVIENLQEDIQNFSLYIFELQDMTEISFDDLSLGSIRALMIYYHNTCKDNNRLNVSFKEFVSQVLSGHYQTWRQWSQETKPEDKELSLSDMKDKGLLPIGLSSDQYQVFNQELKLDFEETFDYKVSDIKFGIRQIIDASIADEHIEAEQLDTSDVESEYVRLISPLKVLSDRQKELKDKIQSGHGLSREEQVEYKSLAEKIVEYRQDYKDDIDRVMALQYIEALKNFSEHNLETKTVTINGKTEVPLKKVFKLLEKVFGTEFPDFVSDLVRINKLIASGFENIYGETRVSREKLHITDRVDVETYVLIGEKPVASCQNYGGHPDLNVGLLSYLIDPNVKIIQIYNESGTIIARSVIRLLSNKDGQPQLFIERVYSSNPHSKINEAVVNFAANKAREMGVGLYSREVPSVSSEQSVEDLYSHGSRSTHVYTDAAGGRIPNGKFTVNRAVSIS